MIFRFFLMQIFKSPNKDIYRPNSSRTTLVTTFLFMILTSGNILILLQYNNMQMTRNILFISHLTG